MNRLRAFVSLILCTIMAGCATGDRYSFLEYSEDPERFGGPKARDAFQLSDQLALKYSKTVASLLRSKAVGARVTREVSSSVQVFLAGLAGAHSAFNLSDSALAVLGLGSAGIPEFQGIFNARGRAEAYTDAVRLIEEAQAEYLLHNQDPSSTGLSQNGVILVQRVQSSIHVVEKTLAGRIPTLLDMQQATARMSEQGAEIGGSRRGSSDATFVTATGTIALPQKRPKRQMTDEQFVTMTRVAEAERPLRGLFTEVTSARLAVPIAVRNEPDFYQRACQAAELPAKERMTEAEYLSVVDDVQSRATLEKLRDYFIGRRGASSGTGGSGGAPLPQTTQEEVIEAIPKVPVEKRVAAGFFNNIATLAGAPAIAPLDEAGFIAHVRTIQNPPTLTKLKAKLLEAAR